MQELKLIVEGPYAILAIKAMAKANLGEVLESINLGLRLLSGKLDFSLSVNEFYALSFYLANCEIPDKWRFSNKDKALIERLIELVIVTSRDDFNEMIVYVNGLDLCLSANKINLLIFDGNDQSSLIQHLYDRMPIHKTCDLAFKGQDILQMGLLQDARMIGRLIDDITYQVITLQLPNDYDAIHHYVQQRLDNINDSGEKNGK
jgi:tRNA nucleotidyltransferase (CCA-adding enzyme)